MISTKLYKFSKNWQLFKNFFKIANRLRKIYIWSYCRFHRFSGKFSSAVVILVKAYTRLYWGRYWWSRWRRIAADIKFNSSYLHFFLKITFFWNIFAVLWSYIYSICKEYSIADERKVRKKRQSWRYVVTHHGGSTEICVYSSSWRERTQCTRFAGSFFTHANSR